MAILTAIAVQTPQRSEAFSDSGWQNTSRLPMPPAFHLVPLRHESEFFVEIAKLRGRPGAGGLFPAATIPAISTAAIADVAAF
jgi:hypothetical protein